VVLESVRGLHVARAENGVWSAALEVPRLLPGEGERVRRALGIAPGGGVRALDSGEPHVVIDADCLGVEDPHGPIDGALTARLAAANADSPVPGGVNVDLVSIGRDGKLGIRTWERGVRRYTASCGTGAAAAAWALAHDELLRGAAVQVHARGGVHSVRLDAGRLRIAAAPLRGTRRPVDEMVQDERVAPALRAALAQLRTGPRAGFPA
jgi:hypothetical protein